MASRFWVEDIVTGLVLTQDLPLNGVQVEDSLNRPGALRGSLPVDHPMATEEIIDEGRRAIYWERDGRIEFGGILWKVDRSIGSRELQLDVEGWLGYWDHRSIWTDRQFTGTEQFEIFETLVDDAQDAGASSDLGIAVAWDAASGVERDRLEEYREWKAANLGESLRRLAGVGGGFDYGMQYAVNLTTNRIDKTIRLWHPTRGRDTGFLFEFDGGAEVTTDGYPDSYPDTYAGGATRRPGGSNVTRWGVARDASNMAWRARGWGDGYDSDRRMSEQIAEERRGVYPLLDAALTEFTSVSDQATLDENTSAALSRRDRPNRLPVVEIDPAKFPKWGDWGLGDRVLLRIDDGWGSTGPAPMTVRIVGYRTQPAKDRPVLAFEEV